LQCSGSRIFAIRIFDDAMTHLKLGTIHIHTVVETGNRETPLKNGTKLIAMAAAAIMLAPLAGCANASSSSTPSHTINIGIKFDQPGLGYKDGSNYTGFDVSVAKYVAKELGYSADEIVWKEAPSKQRETLLENGDVDLVFATYSITDDRKKVVDFGGPYFVAGQDLLIRSTDKSITGPDSLDGKKLCSVTGSTSAQIIKDHYADKVQLMEQSGFAECTTALISGTVDAVTTDDIILAGLAAAKGDGQLKVVGKPFSQERYGVGIPKGKTETVKKVNAALKKMIDDGSWKKALDEATKGTGYTPNATYNPPTVFDAASSTYDFKTSLN
jgi:glutamate transport system substrate-binding protein